MKTLAPETLASLRIEAPDARPHPWSAASGLVRLGQRLFVVADDELGLAEFRLDQPAEPGRCWPLVAGPALPEHGAPRKARKPDLEVLCALPAGPGWPQGALLALGSGSRPTRQSALLQALDAGGAPQGKALRLDATPLFAPLHAGHPGLNIEGACLSGAAFWLAQRGEPGGGPNACIRWEAAAVLNWLRGQSPAPAPLQQHTHTLGQLDGVPLGFTDLAALPGGGLAFSAAAEASDNAYADGAVAGSVLGCIDAHGACRILGRLPGPLKVEGIAVQAHAGGLEWLLVTDADARGEAAQLLRVWT